MDRHIVPGIEAKHAAQAHREDLKIQDEFNCRCMTYWVDEMRDSAFCLIDAPNIESVRKMHDRAHGLIPHEIIKVNSNVVEAFLGRVSDPKGYFDTDDPELKIFNDPAFRIILVSKIDNPTLIKQRLGSQKTKELFALYNEIINQKILEHEGRLVESEGESFIASFVSVTQTVNCAIEILKDLHFAGDLLNIKLGINAGMPVDKSKELFGDTVKMANYLCKASGKKKIMIASIIKEIYKDNRDSTLSDNFGWFDPNDENFVQLLFDTISKNYQDPTFGIEDFSRTLGMSKSKLYRKSTTLTGLSVNVLLRDYRLIKSLEFLKSGRNISQTTFDCGFSSPSYFTKCFQKNFQIKPNFFLKHHF